MIASTRTHTTSAESAPHPIAKGGGGGDNGSMETRMRTVEQAIVRIDAILPTLATKADISDMRGEFGKTQTELGNEIGRVRSELGNEIGMVRSELGNEIGRVRIELGNEIALVRTDLSGEIGKVRSELGNEIDRVRNELGNDIAMVRADLSGEIGKVRSEIGKVHGEIGIEFSTFRSEVYKLINDQTWKIVTWTTAVGAALTAAVYYIARNVH